MAATANATGPTILQFETTKKKKKEPFTINLDGKELNLAVERPQQSHMTEAQKIYNRTYRDAIDAGAIVRARVEKVMREQQLWDDNKQKEHDEILKRILDNEKIIPKGGKKLSELKKLCLDVRMDRFRLRDLTAQRNSLDANTAEAQAENARFNRLVSLCTVYNDTGKPYYKDYDDYMARSDEPVAIEAAGKLAFMLYNLDPNFEANLPENKFLKEWKLVDDKLRLVNKDGHLVDADGKLIDADGRFVDEQGNFLDREGNKVDKDGNYIPENVEPVLDDDGNAITPPGQQVEAAKRVEFAVQPTPSPAKEKSK